MRRVNHRNWRFHQLFFLSFVCVLISACQNSEPPDLSKIQVTPPATRTPFPTPTPVTPYPTLAPDTPVGQVNNDSQERAVDLIAQLDRIYQRLTGIEEFDLNSEIVSQLDAPIRAAIAKLKGIPESGGTEAELETAYADAIAELEKLAKVGTAETVLVELADAGNSMTSEETRLLADALTDGNVKEISAEIESLAEKAEELSAEEMGEIAVDFVNAANELTDATQLIGDLLPEDAAEVGFEVAQKLAQAAASIETGQTKSFLERLAEIKGIVDAIAANLQLAQFLSLTVDNVERETRAVNGLESLLGSGGTVRISNVEIKLIQTGVEQTTATEILPALKAKGVFGPVCILGTDSNVSCLDLSGVWSIPEALAPFSGRMSAITDCGDQFAISTDSELIYLKDNEATPFASDNFPFKAPTQLVCNSTGRIWALPSDTLADSPWFFDGQSWTGHPTILQNIVGTYSFDAAWGTKWEVNENSIVKDNEYIDPIPFVSRQAGQSWDIYYSLNWETGIWGAELDEQGEMWFAGNRLYHLTKNSGWFGYEGKVGPAFAMLSNGMVIGAGPDPATVRVFDRSRTWWELTDWPENFEATTMTTDQQGRVWAADRNTNRIVVWDGSEWLSLPPTVTQPIDLAIIGDGPEALP